MQCSRFYLGQWWGGRLHGGEEGYYLPSHASPDWACCTFPPPPPPPRSSLLCCLPSSPQPIWIKSAALPTPVGSDWAHFATLTPDHTPSFAPFPKSPLATLKLLLAYLQFPALSQWSKQGRGICPLPVLLSGLDSAWRAVVAWWWQCQWLGKWVLLLCLVPQDGAGSAGKLGDMVGVNCEGWGAEGHQLA